VSAPPVLVIGGGVIGLTSAIRLLEAGRRVVVASDLPHAATTSAVAAGAWFPHAVGSDERVLAWGADTFTALAAEAAGPEAPVVMRDTLMLYHADPGPQWWAAAIPGGVRSAEPSILPGGYSHGLRFTAPQALMPQYLPRLEERVRNLGGEIVRRHIASLDAACGEVPLVVNCAGLGAARLAGDASVVPIRGQIVRVANPGLTRSLRDEHHPLGRAYVHPRCDDCILGGTAEAGSWNLEPDREIAASILRRCSDLAPELERAAVLEHRVGLRPGRPLVRLESERHGPYGATVIHNYGHGGAGVTLSWGCASEVVRLATAGSER
jgi:D-amino-acid oxidase